MWIRLVSTEKMVSVDRFLKNGIVASLDLINATMEFELNWLLQVELEVKLK